MSKSSLTFEKFINESLEEFNKGKTMRGITFFSNQNGWRNINAFIPLFNTTRKRWMVNLIHSFQEDFFILNFYDAKSEEKDKNFYIKIIKKDKYYTYLVLSYADYDDFEKFKAFINRNPDMWLGWVGAKFIENFDQFMKQYFPEYSVKLIKYSSEQRDLKSKEKKGSAIHWEIRNKKELEKIRKFRRDEFNELIYVKFAKYQISNNKTVFNVTLSDDTEYTLESGGLLEFLRIYQNILQYAQKLRDIFTRKFVINRKKDFIKKVNESVEILNFDKIETINIKLENPFHENWYDNLISVFSSGFLEDYNIICFELQKGNPYFMTEIVDLENSSRVFLSSLQNMIRICPATEEANPGTVSKIFSILQSNVDPSIDI